jgi:ornithine cyclodeaminase/alanine dehydrogenase-like protein (mu-crystallin family)
MDGTLITAMRTGAVTAVAAKFLARPRSCEIAIIGAGVQGRSNLRALVAALPELNTARVYDIRPEAAARFVEDLGREIPIRLHAVKSAQEAVEAADIVVTGTAVFKQRTPLVRRAWVKPGALIAPLEVDRALEASLVYDPDLLVVDDTGQTLAFKEMGCFSEGEPPIGAELGEIIAGKKVGRTNDDQIIVAMNVGLSIEDIAVGQHIYKRATERNVGQPLRFG